MSDQKRNTGRTDDMDFSALDEELARMAEETPEVPADFHDSWTKMIREEAAAEKPETTAEKSRKERGQLRYILSVAAAFVVLIGGVVIARNSGVLQGTKNAPETPALMANSLTAGKVSEEAEAVYEDAAVLMEQPALLGMSADAMPAPEAESMTSPRKADAAESAQDSVPAAPMLMATSMPAGPAAGAPEISAEAEEEESASVESAAEETETEETVKEAAEEPAEDSAPDTEDTGMEEDARSFLQRAWEGILSAVPWILGGAMIVLFILTRVVRPEKKK